MNKDNGYTFTGGNSVKIGFASLLNGIYDKRKEFAALLDF